MTRTVAREIAVQLGFCLAGKGQDAAELLEGFFDKEYYATLADENELFAEYPSKKQKDYIYAVVSGVSEHAEELDAYIEKYSKGWKISRISKITLSILRTAIFEVVYMDEVPDSVAINEAVELSKGYEEQETVSFINGILGSFMRGERGFVPMPEKDGGEAEEAGEAGEAEEAEESGVTEVTGETDRTEAAGAESGTEPEEG